MAAHLNTCGDNFDDQYKRNIKLRNQKAYSKLRLLSYINVKLGIIGGVILIERSGKLQ